MKEHKSKILILSAFAVLAIASCGKGNHSSSASESSVPSSSQTSESSQTSSETSSSESSQSSSEESSHELENWEGQTFVGQYQGGFTTLIINEDKSTCWDTDTDHLPALMEALPGGIFHIYSDDSVPEEEKVDIYTDGTMAVLVHDAAAKDYFIVDKGAEYGAANALAKKEDGSLMIGSIIVNNQPKCFRAIGNEYQFGIQIELSAGDSIEALGAIFDVVVDGQSSTYRTITAGNIAQGQIAIIQDYQVIKKTYHGENGDLVIGKNGDEIVYVTLDGVAIDPTLVEENENGITIKGGERTLDNSDPTHIVWVYSAVDYTLDEAAMTYVSVDATTREDVFAALDMSQTQFTAVVGEDGNLWATFTPTVGGMFNVEILSGTGDNSYYSYDYDYIAIYRADATSYGSPYSYAEAYAYYYEDYYGDTQEAKIENFVVQAGVTYIIKASNYDDIYNVLGDNDSEHAGESITIGYSYTAFDTKTYNGDQGALVVESYNGAIRSIVLNGQALANYTISGNVITASAVAYDFSDANNPQKTTTSITITLDEAALTYVYESNSASESVFHVITESDTTHSGVVGEDGNLWMIFTPTQDGYFTIEESVSTSSDGYISIYLATAAAFTDDYNHANVVAYGDSGAAANSGYGKISNLFMEEGVSYVIKAGNYYDRGKDLGATGSQYAGATETVIFSFSSVLKQTFTGNAGDLVLSTEDGEYRGATLAGEPIADSDYVDNGDGTAKVSAIGAATIDNTNPLDPTKTSTDTEYVLNFETMTYTSSSATNVRHLFKEITATPATLSTIVSDDGNLWAKFTPDADGYLTVEELICTTTDGYLAIYESTATSFVPGSYGAYNYIAKSDATGDTREKIENLEVHAGVTYIIKAGAYADNSKLVDTTTKSTFYGKTESIRVSFSAFSVATYAGEGGDLVITTAGTMVKSATLNGVKLNNASINEDGDLVIAGAATIDNSDPSNPTSTSTDTVYHLDAENLAYTVTTETTSKKLFLEATGSGEFETVVGKDGNLWVRFVAPRDGTIDVSELVCTASDGYLAIYAADATSYAPSNYLAYSDKSYNVLEEIKGLEVTKNSVYIIKAGAYADRSNLINTSSTSSNAGKTEKISITFNPNAADVYTSEGGDQLVVYKKGDVVSNIELNGSTLEGAVLDNGVITIEGALQPGEGGKYTKEIVTITLDSENFTFTQEKVVVTFASSDAYTVGQVGSYSFVYDEAAGTYTSNNNGVISSTATMTITVQEAGLLSFHYDVDSEGTTKAWDYLTILVNGVAVEGFEAQKIGCHPGKAGDFTLAVSAGDVITFSYIKDNSGNDGRDNAIISNLLLLTEQIEG